MNKPVYSAQHEELRNLCLDAEMRVLNDDADKAVHVLLNYTGNVYLSQTSICDYFNISRNTLKKRLWSTLLGHTDHSVKNPRYLALCHEQDLYNITKIRGEKRDSVTDDELLEIVV